MQSGLLVDLAGRTALVTGAASGIGLASAQLLTHCGASIAFADINASGAQAAREAAGNDHIALEVDVSDSRAVQTMVDQTVERFGQIDILVHCAGISPRRTVVEMSDEDWRRVLAVNLDGTMYVARSVAKAMVPRKNGTMVMIASDNGVYGQAAKSAYAASKGGVIAFAKSLALELGPSGITVNALNPGTTDTPMLRAEMPPEVRERRLKSDPLGRLSDPTEVAQTVLFLAGVGGRYMTGQLITMRMRGL